MRYLFIYILLLSANSIAQNGWENVAKEEFANAILTSEQTVEDGQSYSYNSEFNFYENITSESPEITMNATFICNDNKELFMSQFGRLMVQNDQLNVVCDTANKQVIVAEPKEIYLKRKSSDDFKQIIEGPSILKKKNEANLIKYYLEFPKGGTYMAAEVWFDNKHMVKKYILYTAGEYYDDSQEEDRVIRPRMEVDYLDFKVGDQVNTSNMLHVKDFVVNNKKELSLHSDYSDYKLIDLRISNK